MYPEEQRILSVLTIDVCNRVRHLLHVKYHQAAWPWLYLVRCAICIKVNERLKLATMPWCPGWVDKQDCAPHQENPASLIGSIQEKAITSTAHLASIT